MVDMNEHVADVDSKTWAAGVMVAVIMITVGCAPPAEDKASGPSYADLVVIYNTELEQLDRLEGKRMELVQQIAAVGSGADGSALDAINAVIASTQASAGEIGGNLPADPNDALDQAVERAQATQ